MLFRSVQIPQLPRAAIARASVDDNGKIIVCTDLHKACLLYTSPMSIRQQYDSDLEALKAALVEMGSNSAEAVEAALEALRCV